MTTLLTFVDATDPFAPALLGEASWLGPTLTLLSLRSFDRVVLLAGPADQRIAAQTARAITGRFPSVVLEQQSVQDAELAGLSRLAARLAREVDRWTDAPNAAVASVGAGPVLARAAWLVVASAGPRRFSLVDVDSRRYATDHMPRVIDVTLSGSAPPSGRDRVREPAVAYHAELAAPGVATAGGHGAVAAPDLDAALRRLGMCGAHPVFRQAVETAAAVAPHKVPVLIQGETGTGKGMMAQLIHTLSGRAPDAFVSVNCAALPEQLVESILFGHRKGAFTGAASDQPGKFELADEGTIFLDEIGELPLALQPKLLKVLEDGVVEALGASRGRRIDARVVAATNCDLQQAVAKKTFREDLYYRLSFARIALPPLRERRSDIHHLALRLLEGINASLRTPRRLSRSALQRLEQHDWPGNVRDLENVIGRSILLSSRDQLEAEDLLIDSTAIEKDPLLSLPAPREGFVMEEFLEQARRQLIVRALDLAAGSQSGAARLLGVTPQAIHRFVHQSAKPAA